MTLCQTIFVPSGDHAGPSACVSPPVKWVSGVIFPPSGRIVKRFGDLPGSSS